MEKKTVPLVTYRNGIREVIGEVTVGEDEQGFYVQGIIHDPKTMEMLGMKGGDVSIGPFPQDQFDVAITSQAVRGFRETKPWLLRGCVYCDSGKHDQAPANAACPCCFNSHVFGK